MKSDRCRLSVKLSLVSPDKTPLYDKTPRSKTLYNKCHINVCGDGKASQLERLKLPIIIINQYPEANLWLP